MKPDPSSPELVDAARELARLSVLAAGMQEQLAGLQRQLAAAECELDGSQSAGLLEANTRLVQAALSARSEAAAAHASLEALSLASCKDPLTGLPNRALLLEALAMAQRHGQPPGQSDQQQLQEANTHLVVAAMQAQAGEAVARDRHHRQIQSMAMVAHELRNPLTPIRIAASLLANRSPGDEPSLPRLQHIIEGQVTHMTRLVEDLLEMSRATLGKLRLECVQIDLGEVLALAVQSCSPGMVERSQVLTMDLGTAPLLLHGDPVRLAQVFCNLLDNAAKYSPPGAGITLRACKHDGRVTVTVRDQGAGISAAAIDGIFDLFVQAEHALQLDKRGLGIGLAVVRELVQAHGGTVSVHSGGEGQGSEFTVVLPVGMPPPPAG